MNFRKNQKGQMIVEYILLLVVSVALALILIKLTDVTTNTTFLNFWSQILTAIAEDIST